MYVQLVGEKLIYVSKKLIRAYVCCFLYSPLKIKLFVFCKTILHVYACFCKITVIFAY